jgi:hypothetical protein
MTSLGLLWGGGGVAQYMLHTFRTGRTLNICYQWPVNTLHVPFLRVPSKHWKTYCWWPGSFSPICERKFLRRQIPGKAVGTKWKEENWNNRPYELPWNWCFHFRTRVLVMMHWIPAHLREPEIRFQLMPLPSSAGPITVPYAQLSSRCTFWASNIDLVQDITCFYGWERSDFATGCCNEPALMIPHKFGFTKRFLAFRLSNKRFICTSCFLQIYYVYPINIIPLDLISRAISGHG